MWQALVRGSLAVATAMVLACAAGAKPSPPTDHGFPLDEYLHEVLHGKLFVGGTPPTFVGAKTKDKIFVIDGKAHYQPQVALRRAGRDDGKGRFVILKARSWGSALAYVMKLNPGVIKFFRIAFPAGIGGTKFPTLYASLTYTFEIAANAPSPQFKAVDVASQPHPDPALRKKGVTLVTLKKGVTPGNYLIRLTAEADLAPHPLKSLYEAYGAVTGAIEWAAIALAPEEVALEKLVDKGIETLVDKAAEGDKRAIATLGKQATREAVTTTALKNAVKSALTKTETIYEMTVPTVVPDLRGLTKSLATARLQERFLRWTFLDDALTQDPGLAGRVKTQSVATDQKRPVGSHVVVHFWALSTATPVTGTTTTSSQPATLISFLTPQVIDKIQILGFKDEAFRIWACDPAKTGSCDKTNPASDIRVNARVFCQRNVPAPEEGSRVGADQHAYPREAPDPGDYGTVPAGTRWVSIATGFVSYTVATQAFTVIRCLSK